MLTQKNLLFLKRCFDVGRLATSTSPNPSVGSVIVAADGRIIGEGYTSPYGGAHAEVMAVASVKSADRVLLPTATIYVTLEPCHHFGKTPPCVDLIIREKIAKVVIAFLDPNPLVAGQSITKLRENGAQVQIYNNNNLLKYENMVPTLHQAESMTEGLELFQKGIATNCLPLENGKIRTLIYFLTNIIKKRPYIILKWAESADGFIGQEQQRLPISNNFTKKIVHKWRSEVDAIMVGTTTAAVDNPELNNRLYFGKSPIRVVLDKNRRLSPHLNIFDGLVKTLIFSEKNSKNPPNTDLSRDYREGGANIEFHEVVFDESVLENILAVLHANKIGILFVEGGERLLSSFIERGLWDEARVFTAEKTLGSGIRAPQLINSTLHQTLQIDDNTLRIFRPSAI